MMCAFNSGESSWPTATRPRTNATFGFLVSDVSRMLRENFRTTTPELGLTLAQARVLVHSVA
jgi:hypothetical protein